MLIRRSSSLAFLAAPKPQRFVTGTLSYRIDMIVEVLGLEEDLCGPISKSRGIACIPGEGAGGIAWT
jgi:hypothetical protein